ncbi:MAG: glycoside hydrolase family 57 protein [Candidatus Paceibacterota bacterium]
MASICFYFQVHQPFRVKKYGIFDIGDADYFTDDSETDLNNKRILKKVANKCYLPANKVLKDVLDTNPDFRASFSFSGVFLEQCALYAPEVLESFKELVETGRVELMSETYYHSLAALYSQKEFEKQVKLHSEVIQEIFDLTPQVFRNTELIYNNEIAKEAKRMGFKAVLAEGADHILGWRSPNFLYQPTGIDDLALLLKNYRLSDDVAFRFGEKAWKEYPLTAEKFANWVSAHNGSGEIINLFMDYETFGEHQWEDTGIFDFLRHFPAEYLKHPDNDFVTPTEAIERYKTVGELDVPNYVSWADVERDISAWRSNEIQYDALRCVYEMEREVIELGDQEILHMWRKLQTSDHFYYMCTKYFEDGDVHKYFNPYDSPYDSYINFMNILDNLIGRCGDLKLALVSKLPQRN